MLMHEAATSIFDTSCNKPLQLMRNLEDMGLLDEDDDVELLHLLMHKAAIQRKKQFVRTRMDFASFADDLESESAKEFYSMFRMRRQSFEKLVKWLKPYLDVNGTKSSNSSSGVAPIDPHIQIFCLIRYLAGGAYQDIRVIAGISTRSFYSSIKKSLIAVLKCPELLLVLCC